MGNTTSNKFCPKPNDTTTEDDKLYGCLGKRYITSVYSPVPPTIIENGRNLFLEEKSNIIKISSSTHTYRDWNECNKFVIDRITPHCNKTDDAEIEKERMYIYDHLCTFGWVERSYESTNLLRGEIIAPNKFCINLLVDQPIGIRSMSGEPIEKYTFDKKLGPFSLDCQNELIDEEINKIFADKENADLLAQSIISVFSKPESINLLITNGYISDIVDSFYYKVSVEYML